MLKDERIVILGPGVMGEAMAKSLLAVGEMQADQILMSGPRENRLAALSEQYGFQTTTDNQAAVADAEIVILAVKPQTVYSVMEDIKGALTESALVISIVAGTPLRVLVEGMEHASVVRSMPNTPAQVAQGITVWTATRAVSGRQLEQTRAVIGAFGEEIFVEDEDYLDMATALSGTGPAYAFLFMEAMVDAGVHLGFPRRIAERLVVQTLKGAVAFYEHSPRHMARLRNQVTSPGGTSAAALYYLEKAGFRTAISRAIWAAYERSVQLGEGQKRGAVGTE
ncbi:MAG: pyrroline-5-carboxylate reductase [Anaerolineales bacterium]|nr:pyrroline-5-carboxylate reductase [Anaerolineales bacterium]